MSVTISSDRISRVSRQALAEADRTGEMRLHEAFMLIEDQLPTHPNLIARLPVLITAWNRCQTRERVKFLKLLGFEEAEILRPS